MERFICRQFPKECIHIRQRLRSEVIKLSDYIVGVFLSPMVKCEGFQEIVI